MQALFNLANLQRQCGEVEAAVRSYERVLELSPDSWRGLLNYSVALVGLGRELEAKQALRRAFRLSGESAGLPACTTSPEHNIDDVHATVHASHGGDVSCELERRLDCL